MSEDLNTYQVTVKGAQPPTITLEGDEVDCHSNDEFVIIGENVIAKSEFVMARHIVREPEPAPEADPGNMKDDVDAAVAGIMDGDPGMDTSDDLDGDPKADDGVEP